MGNTRRRYLWFADARLTVVCAACCCLLLLQGLWGIKGLKFELPWQKKTADKKAADKKASAKQAADRKK